MVDQVPMGYVHSHIEFDPKPSLGAAGAPPQNHSKIAPEGVYFRSFFEWSYLGCLSSKKSEIST